MNKYINKIINADCLDILKELPDNYFDLCLCDPPYGVGDKFKGGKNSKMNKFGDFPFLVGVTSNRHAVKLENSTEAVADFICTKGVDGDLCVLTPDGDKVLNTFGIYIDRCSDFDYLEKLRPVLVEKQMKLESSLGLGASL